MPLPRQSANAAQNLAWRNSRQQVRKVRFDETHTIATNRGDASGEGANILRSTKPAKERAEGLCREARGARVRAKTSGSTNFGIYRAVYSRNFDALSSQGHTVRFASLAKASNTRC